MEARAARRALIVVGILVVLIIMIVDLSSPDSVLRATWRRLTRQETRLERIRDDLEQQLPDRPTRGGALAPPTTPPARRTA